MILRNQGAVFDLAEIKNPLLSTIHFRKMCYTILECMFDKIKMYESEGLFHREIICRLN